MEAELVDVALLYECPYEGKLHVLVIRNAIHIDSMENILIPPIILQEAGLQVNERAKIHTEGPMTDNHSIAFPTTGFRIPLQLFGVFSYFSTTKPTEDDMLAGHDVYVMTPEKWNPHSDAYAQNEANIVDWEGNIKQQKDWIKVIIDELSGEADMTPEKWNPHSDAYVQNEANIVDWEGNIKQPKDWIKVIIDELSGEANEGEYRISSVEMDVIDRMCAKRKLWLEDL